MPVGTIPIDALFSPISKVNYIVTNARVGQQTDYDKLTLEVWTNGSVRPEDAVAYAAKILKEQLNHLHQLRGDGRAGRGDGREEAGEAQREPRKSVDELELVGALGELPAERQHHATSASSCRRPRPRC